MTLTNSCIAGVRSLFYTGCQHSWFLIIRYERFQDADDGLTDLLLLAVGLETAL